MQLLWSLDNTRSAIERIYETCLEWDSFVDQFDELKRKSSRRQETQLSLYRRTLGKAIEERLSSHLKVNVLREDQRQGQTEGPKTEIENAHRKGYEEGYQAAMRDFEKRQREERKGK